MAPPVPATNLPPPHGGQLPWQLYARGAELPPMPGARAGVFGLGVTGRSVGALLLHAGTSVRLVDESAKSEEAARKALPAATWCGPPLADDVFAGLQFVFVSTGIDPAHRALAWARAHGILVVGEVELVGKLYPMARAIGITGTNGKSTTTTLTGELVAAASGPTFVGGNLGTPVADWPLEEPACPALVLELSSYQVDAMHDAELAVGAVLNVTPDHLERYGSFANYAESKARLVERVASGGIAVLNADDPKVAAMAPRCWGQVWWFGCGPLPGPGLQLAPGDVAVPVGGLEATWSPISLRHPGLLGQHNRLNAMASLLAAQALVAPQAAPGPAVLAALAAFKGLAHRLEPVGEYRGATWLNDSKATNDAAAATGVRAMERPFVLLLGGVDKGGGYREVVAALRAPATPKLRGIVVFGAARAPIQAALAEGGLTCTEAAALEDACAWAAEHVQPGDAVLLSPACSSFDGFANYIARGHAFAAWVRAQAAKGG